jgi:diguanylate cyclase (GGDEF)-like protein
MLLDVRHLDGSFVPCDVAVSTPARTGLDAFLLQFRRRGGVVHLQRALVDMAKDLPISPVLGRLALGLATDITRSRVEIHADWDGASFAASASSDGYSVVAEDDQTEPGERPWRSAMEQRRPVYFDDVESLPDRVGHWARKLELTSALAAPVVSNGDPVAVVVLWRRGPVDWTFIPARDLDHIVDLVALVHRWDRGRESLRYAASHDPLTGLANRRTLLDHLRSPRSSGESGTILFCDVDDFKPVNDQHGHAAGDAVLNVIGERLRQSVRPKDLVARYGGDEFVVYCHTTDVARVDDIAERLEESLRRPITIGDVTVEVGLSVGRSVVTAEDDVDAVLAAASRDMSETKRRRKAAR